MQEAFSNLINVVDFIDNSIDSNLSDIVDLTSGVWIEGASVEQDDVVSFFLLLNVFQNCNNFGVKPIASVIEII